MKNKMVIQLLYSAHLLLFRLVLLCASMVLDEWVDGCKSRFENCLQQLKNFSFEDNFFVTASIPPPPTHRLDQAYQLCLTLKRSFKSCIKVIVFRGHLIFFMGQPFT